ncbi:MAG: hypothetical protein F4Z57_12380 [Gemmatimonadetes bacterium]|nr:hypothetical protein [Gemmatimonadota bacterium]MYC71619.1 hypothetical protein [Gemmatimonadota bacterium]
MSESQPQRPYPLDHEGRIARLEGIVEQIDVRLGRIETKLDVTDGKIDATREVLESKIDANDAKIDATRDSLDGKIDRLYRWVIPLQITTIIAIAGLAFKAFTG